MDVDDLPIDYRSTRRYARDDGNLPIPDSDSAMTVMSIEFDTCRHQRARSATSAASHSRAAFADDRIQYWLNVRRRAGDNTRNFAGRSLLLQRLGEIAVAFLQLFEQPHVFDRDHSLIGESLDQLNLALSKWLDKVTPDRYGSNCRTLSQQWYCQPCPFAGLTGCIRDIDSSA